MKKIIRLLGFMLIGAIIGLAGMGAGLMLFTDITWQEYWEELFGVELLPALGEILLNIVAFMAAVYVQIILHEGGHLLFGLRAGFRFVSFRVGSWTLIRQDGRYRMKRFSMAGTGGQCLLSPPDKGITSAAFALYNMGGVLMNLLAALAVVLVWVAFRPLSDLAGTFVFFFFLSGFLLALMNGIPLRLSGVSNDGYNMLLVLRKDNRATQSLQLQLRVNALIQEGVRLKDMPEEWFVDEAVADYRDVLQVGSRMLLAARYMDLKEYDKSRSLYEELLEHRNEIIGLYVKEFTCEVLFLELIGECRQSEVEKLYTKDIQDYIAQYRKVMAGKQTLACALALYWEKQPEQAMEIYQEVMRKKDNYLMQGEVASCIELMEEMLEMATCARHSERKICSPRCSNPV